MMTEPMEAENREEMFFAGRGATVRCALLGEGSPPLQAAYKTITQVRIITMLENTALQERLCWDCQLQDRRDR